MIAPFALIQVVWIYEWYVGNDDRTDSTSCIGRKTLEDLYHKLLRFNAEG
jgi:hypothetical protein